MAYVYMISIPMFAVVLTGVIVHVQSLQDRIVQLQDHVNLLDSYIAERLRAYSKRDSNYLWTRPASEQDADHD